MDTQKLRKILERYANDTANEVEQALIQAWYKSYESAEQNLDDADVRARMHNARSIVLRSNLQAKRFNWFILKIAAVLVTVLVSGLLYFQSQPTAVNYVTITNDGPGLKKTILNDGTILWVNSATSIRIPKVFSDTVRLVYLDEGEAFFDVSKDPDRPFSIHSRQTEIRVVGTSFNVQAYKKLKSLQVGVVSGRVIVNNRGRKLGMLTAGDMISINEVTGDFKRSTTDTDRIKGWKSGRTYLQNAGFNELALRLKNIYGITIKPGTPAMAEHRFTLCLMHHVDREQVLELIAEIHDSNYRKEGDELIFY